MRKFLLIIVAASIMLGCTIASSLDTSDRYSAFNIYNDRTLSIEDLTAALDSSIEQKDRFSEGLIKMEIGKRLRNKSQFDQAMELHRSAQDIAYELGDTLLIVKSYNEIGTVYRRIDALNEAIQSHYKALHYSELFSDSLTYVAKKQKTIALNSIGNISLVLEFYDKAEESFRKCIEIETGLKSDLGVAINYANLGAIFDAKGIRDSAMFYYELSLEHNVKAKSQIGISLCYNSIGELYEDEGKLEEAKEYYLKGYDIIKDNSDVWHKLVLYIATARINIKQGNYTTGLSDLEQAFVYAEQVSSPEHLAAIYMLWSEYYEKIGDLKRSSESLKKSYQYVDAGRRKEEQESFMYTNVNYVTELSKERAELQAEVIQQQQQKQKLLNYTVILSILALFIVGYALFLVYRNNRKLLEINAMKNRLFSVVSHDLKNPALALKMSLSSLNNEIDKTHPHLKKQVEMTLTLKATEEHVELLNNLLDWARIQGLKIKYTPVVADLYIILNDVKHSIEQLAHNKQISVSLNIPNECYAEADIFMLSTVIRNLLSNALKFSKRGGEVEIIVKEFDNLWQVYVVDNGVGMSKDQIQNLFAKSNSKTTLGTGGEKGTGLGFIICRELVSMWGGKIDVESEKGRGTKFIVTVKKHLL